MKLCVIGKTNGVIEEILQDPSLKPLLANLEVLSVDEKGSNDVSLTLKGSYARGGGIADRCRNPTFRHVSDISPAVGIGAIMNPADLKQLMAGNPKDSPSPSEVKIFFQ